MTEHTATTRHLVDITVAVSGDDGIDPGYLVDVLMWGLEKHNELAGDPERNPEGLDQVIEPLIASVTLDIGLGAEEAVVQDALNPSDPMEMPLGDCVLVIGDMRKRF